MSRATGAGRVPWLAAGVAVVLVALFGLIFVVTRPAPERAAWVTAAQSSAGSSAPSTPSASPSPQESVGPPAPPEAGLKVIDYGPAPGGFPADPEPASTVPLTTAAHPTRQIPAYDAPGGRARAYLAPTIAGVPLIMPIAAHRADWVAVILPSVDRTVAWLAPGGWNTVDLHEQLVVRRSQHQLSWYHDGALQQSWTVTLGDPHTPTPLGRTFVLGRSALPDKVYAGVDVLALGAVPDQANSVPTGLRGAHTGIHTWYNNDTFGKSVSNGCIRVPKPGQLLLLSQIVPGSSVVVVD